MKNLLFLLVLGLLALVQATPLTAVTQIPAVGEDDDVLREALTDGFLVGHVFTTETPGTNVTAAATSTASTQPQSEGGSEDNQVTMTTAPHEDGNQVTETTTTQVTMTTAPHEDGNQVTETTTSHEDGNQVTETTTAQVTMTTALHEDGNQVTETTTSHEDGNQVTMTTTSHEGGSPVTETTQGSTPDLTSTLTPSDADSSVSTSTSDWTVTATTPDLSTVDFLTSDSGSGQSEDASRSSAAPPAAQTSASAPPSSTSSSSPLFENSDGSGSGFGSGFADEPAPEPSTTTTSLLESRAPIAPRFFINETESKPADESPSKPDPVTIGKTEGAEAQVSGSGTPGWMIIVGFIVGVAALVLLCVAIATRDKWNGPNAASRAQSKVESSNQQGEQETELLHKQQPRENGKSEEYTVIPLEEMPESYSSD